jgi:hypothetical protein
MRGSPPRQLAILLALFIALAVPLLQLTHARSEKPAGLVTSTQPQAALPALIQLRYAHRPTTLTLRLGDQAIMVGSDFAESPIEIEHPMVVPKEGFELHVTATWPAGTSDTAITLQIEPEGLDRLDHTVWSQAEALDSYVTFQWP